MPRRTTDELTAHLAVLRAAPREEGTLALVVRRPAQRKRDVLEVGELDLELGLVGDNWRDRATSRAIASGRHLKAQVTVMSHRMVSFLAEDDAEQALAGDQLYVDLDLSHDNLPAGTRLSIGDPEREGAVIAVTEKPHTGCKKFLERFGQEAVDFVNSETGRAMRLRGLNAQVVGAGLVRPGDPVRRI